MCFCERNTKKNQFQNQFDKSNPITRDLIKISKKFNQNGTNQKFSQFQPPKKDTKSSAKQPQKTQKKKEGGSGGKAKKKKWSKGKVRDKLNNQVLFDKATYEKLYKEVPSYKLITPSVVSERLKIRGSLAKRALIELRDKGELKN